MPDKPDDHFVFIVGSPRSGTTVLGEILEQHPEICQWYEPYFVWDHHFRRTASDERSETDATVPVIDQIRSDFCRFHRRRGRRLVVDKSPRNSLKIPFIRKIFPNARFIHLLRDGRDVTLSIHREWQRRQHIVSDRRRRGRFDALGAIRVIRSWLNRQPFFQDRIRALWFETHGHLFDLSKHLNRIRWNGAVGWGPRFDGWEAVLSGSSLLQFNAAQWAACVQRIGRDWPSIPAHRKIEIRYEHLVTEGNQVLSDILGFLDAPPDGGFFNRIPRLRAGNFDKWKQAFDRNQGWSMQPILTPQLMRLDYETDPNWPDRLPADVDHAET